MITSLRDIYTLFVTIGVGLLIVGVFVVVRLNANDDYACDTRRRRRKEKFIREAKTGDLICVSYHSMRGKLVRVFTGSIWIHIGLVVRTVNGQAYVIEVARYDENEKGLLFKKLEDWLDYNGNNRMAIRPYTGKGLSTSKLLTLLREHRETDINLYVVEWLQTMYKQQYRGDRKDSYYCSEFVAYMLQELGVLKKVYEPCGYKPWELLYGDMPYTRGHAYGEPYMLK